MLTIPLGLFTRWPNAYPRHRGVWTLRGAEGDWAVFDPATSLATEVDPAADEALPGLGPSLRHGTLVGYRHGRRAVVRTRDHYLKIVRPKRARRLQEVHDWLPSTCPAIATPEVVEVSSDGVVATKPVDGTSLHEIIRGQRDSHIRRTICDLAFAMSELHASAVPVELPHRREASPDEWVSLVATVEPDHERSLARRAAQLPAAPQIAHVLTHGDLHDKNVHWAQGRVALLDLDSIALAPAEDDVANMAVHLQLRALQAGQDPARGREWSTLLIEQYRRHRPLDQSRLDAVARHTWFRLACIYRFRAGTRALVPELLLRSGEAFMH